MSFNIYISHYAPIANRHELDRESTGTDTDHPAADRCSAALDEEPTCGTRYPGQPPVPHWPGSLIDQCALNPQPLPPGDPGAGEGAGRSAEYDDGGWCGTVPHLPRSFPPVDPTPWSGLASFLTAVDA